MIDDIRRTAGFQLIQVRNNLVYVWEEEEHYDDNKRDPTLLHNISSDFLTITFKYALNNWFQA